MSVKTFSKTNNGIIRNIEFDTFFNTKTKEEVENILSEGLEKNKFLMLETDEIEEPKYIDHELLEQFLKRLSDYVLNTNKKNYDYILVGGDFEITSEPYSLKVSKKKNAYSEHIECYLKVDKLIPIILDFITIEDFNEISEWKLIKKVHPVSKFIHRNKEEFEKRFCEGVKITKINNISVDDNDTINVEYEYYDKECLCKVLIITKEENDVWVNELHERLSNDPQTIIKKIIYSNNRLFVNQFFKGFVIFSIKSIDEKDGNLYINCVMKNINDGIESAEIDKELVISKTDFSNWIESIIKIN